MVYQTLNCSYYYYYMVMIFSDETEIDMGRGILAFIKSELCVSLISYPLTPTGLEFLPLGFEFCI